MTLAHILIEAGFVAVAAVSVRLIWRELVREGRMILLGFGISPAAPPAFEQGPATLPPVQEAKDTALEQAVVGRLDHETHQD